MVYDNTIRRKMYTRVQKYREYTDVPTEVAGKDEAAGPRTRTSRSRVH